ncbi:MAG TPA: hypothetical protein VED16_00285 [Candidatus Acidoferrum sp.]|nr:hypothetical protein [Candidatus Acidoferrum sp.]
MWSAEGQLSCGWISPRLIDDTRNIHEHTSFDACMLGYSHFTSSTDAIGRTGRNIISILASKMACSRICSLNGLIVTVFSNARIELQSMNPDGKTWEHRHDPNRRWGIIYDDSTSIICQSLQVPSNFRWR